MYQVHSTNVVKVSELLRVFQSELQPQSEDLGVQGFQQMLQILLFNWLEFSLSFVPVVGHLKLEYLGTTGFGEWVCP